MSNKNIIATLQGISFLQDIDPDHLHQIASMGGIGDGLQLSPHQLKKLKALLEVI